MIADGLVAIDLTQIGAGTPKLAIVLAFMIPIAIAVYYLGNRRYRRDLGRTLGGRTRWGKPLDVPIDPTFAAQLRRFEERPAGRIAEAPEGLCKVAGTLCGADVTLGGRPGFECVWRNRADGRRDMAVAAETVFLGDGTAQASIEGLEHAQVIAPIETGARNIEWQGLYLGDEVEVIGRLVLDPEAPASDDPSARILGTLGGDGKLHVRLVRRPAWPSAPAEATEDAPTTASAGPAASPDLVPSTARSEDPADADAASPRAPTPTPTTTPSPASTEET
ncbi:MAG: hypothetical protein R3B09_22130 [Nannocystaceae bacterium]